MDRIVYSTRVRFRRGRWHVSVPALPGRPRVIVKRLDHAAPDLILTIAGYLGVNETLIGVDVRQPARPARTTLRSRLSATAAQAWGALATLSGVYLAVGLAATLITAGIAVTALGVLREAGRI